MLEEGSDASTIDSSKILQAAKYIPSEIIIDSDDDDEEWIDEQVHRNIFDSSFFYDEADLWWHIDLCNFTITANT